MPRRSAVPSEAYDTDEPELPDDAAAVVWAVQPGNNKGFHLGGPRRHAEHLPDDIDLSDTNEGREPTIVFEPGEEIPVPIAEDLYPDWHDRMAVFDADGDRVGERGESEVKEAIRLWRHGE